MNAPTTNLPAERKPAYNEVAIESHGGGGMLRPSSLGEVVDLAQLMAKADVAVPKHLRGNVGACVSVAMQAFRWEMDPFAVANKSYAVNDRLAYEAQLCAAVVNMRAPIIGRPDYIYEGDGPSRVCKVVCVMHDGEVREYTSPRFDKITTKNSPLWKSDPDQQLGYFAIRSWARRHAPEVLLGVYTPDELREEAIRDVTPATGLRDRLAGPGAEGFSSVHAEPSEPVAFADAAAEVAEAEFEAPADEIAPEEFPGDRQHPAVAWAKEVQGRLDAEEWGSVDDLDDFTQDQVNVQTFLDLHEEDPQMAKALDAALRGRRKALAAKEGGHA